MGAAAKVYLSLNLAPDRVYGVYHVELGPTVSAAEKKQIKDTLVNMLTGDGSKIDTRRTITIKGREWEEITLKQDKSKFPVLRFLQTEKSVYALIGQKETGEMLTRFLDSFELLE